MRRMNWLTSLFRRSVTPTTSLRRATNRDPVQAASPPVEQLESRELLAVFSVNPNVADGAAGSLRAAIQNSNTNQADDTIYLAPGRYVLSLDNSVAETAVGDRGDLDVTESGKTLVLQGSGTDSTILDAAGLDRVLEAHPGSTLVLRDLTLTGGKADQGGGLFADQASLVLDKVTILENAASEGGGAYASNSAVTITDSRFLNNSATSPNETKTARGGGLFLENSHSEVRNSEFQENKAIGGDGADGADGSGVGFDDEGFYHDPGPGGSGEIGSSAQGGAIFQQGSQLELINTTIHQNEARGGHGGSGGYGGRDSSNTFDDGAGADGGEAQGGGVFVFDGSFRLVDSSVGMNHLMAGGAGGKASNAGANAEGAGIFLSRASAEILRSTLNGNEAQAGGGAFGREGEEPRYRGQHGVNNGQPGGIGGAVRGTGLFVGESDATLIDSRVTENKATGGDGGGGGNGNSAGDYESSYAPGGSGGSGGQGGSVFGTGIFVSPSRSLSVVRSEVANNHGVPGLGGERGENWGYGGPSGPSGARSAKGTVTGDVVGSVSETSTTGVVTLPESGGQFQLTREQDDVVLRNADQIEVARLPFESVSHLEIIGSPADDTLVVGGTLANLIAWNGLRFDGAGGTDRLQLSGQATNVVRQLGTDSIVVDGRVIDFANVEVVDDSILAVNRWLDATDGNDTLELSGGSAADDQRSQIHWNGTTIDFANPTESLRIDAGDGADRVTLTSVDAGLMAAIVVNGGGGDDQLVSMLTNSVRFVGGDGNDSIRAGTNGDTLVGGEGNDSLFGGLGADLLIGGEGDDLLFGGAGSDRLFGETGRDMLTGNAGFDTLLGGDDADTLRGGAQNDVLDGGAGFDQMLEIADDDFTLTPSQLIVQRRVANAVDPNAVPVVGSPLDIGTSIVLPDNVDQLINIESAALLGGVSSNRLDASKFGGPVALHGFNGDDTLLGGTNDDILEGGDGNDQLDGGNGVNRLLAVGDVDWRLTSKLLFGMGTDSFQNIAVAELRGGASANRLNAAKFNGQVTLIGGDGDDTLIGSDQNDVLIGDAGDDQLFAKGGNDSLTGGDGHNLLGGGPGIDRVVESGDVDFVLTARQLSRTGTLARLVDTTNGGEVTSEVTGKSARPTDLSSIEEAELTGGDGNNRISAKKFGGVVTLRGGAGDDTLEGGNGADLLDGRAGRDRLLGRAGDDTLLGGSEKDLLLGGDGNDQLNGGDGADVLNGEAGADHSMGEAGNDVFVGDLANDTLDGGSGSDAVTLSSTGNITLTDAALTWTATASLSGIEQANLQGDVGAQQLDASVFSGDVTLDGSTGADTLLGGRGDDVLKIESLNTATVDGGAGLNVLRPSDRPVNIDLTGSMPNLKRISRLNLTGSEIVNVTINAQQFVSQSGKNERLKLDLDSDDRMIVADPYSHVAPSHDGLQHVRSGGKGLDVSNGTLVTLAAPVQARMPTGFVSNGLSAENLGNGQAPQVADLNGDGAADIVRGDGQLFWNDGQGNFVADTHAPIGHVVIGDVDGDGDQDMVTDQGQLLQNDGAGHFTSSIATAIHGEIVALRDLNGDGVPDLVMFDGATYQSNWRSYSTESLVVLMNDGAGQFHEVQRFDGVPRNGHAVSVVDIDADGDLDLFQSGFTAAKTRLWLNSGDGHFTRSHRSLFGDGVGSVEWGDVDDDGDVDALVYDSYGKWSWWMNSAGVFTANGQRVNSIVGGNILSVTPLDIDGDGDLDLAVTRLNQSGKVLLNQNGVLKDSGLRFGQLDTSRFATTTYAADFNGDGAPDLLAGDSSGFAVFLSHNATEL